jgi:exosortase D (VPLPA-CTERM-specific)
MPLKNKSLPALPLTIGTMLAVIILWFYWSTLALLAKQLTDNEDYSFGLLIPLVVGYIVYLKWPQIRRLPWQPSWMGLAVIAMGFALFIMGDLLAFFYFPAISFIMILAGVLYLLGGWPIVRFLSFPLLLLLLIIPLPSVILQQLTFKLQLLSSYLSAGILQALGIPAVRQGNIIDLGIRQLQVVEACSGLRYILSLLALVMIYCYFYQRYLWKAALLVLSIFPLAILANTIRLACMALWPALQEGFLHTFSGWLIFIFCFGMLGLLNWGMNYLQPPVKTPDAGGTTPLGEVPPGRRPSHSPYLIAALVLVAFVSPLSSMLHAPPIPLAKSFDNFPLQLGPWQGRRSYLDSAMVARVGASDYLNANYVNNSNAAVNLWIAFFESQSKNISGRIHSPLICLSGGGWKIKESSVVNLTPELPVHYLLIEYATGGREAVYYWYIQGGRWTASEYSVKLFMSYDGLMRRRNDGALIRLITPVDTNVASARERLSGFARLMIPILPEFFVK